MQKMLGNLLESGFHYPLLRMVASIYVRPLDGVVMNIIYVCNTQQHTGGASDLAFDVLFWTLPNILGCWRRIR